MRYIIPTIAAGALALIAASTPAQQARPGEESASSSLLASIQPPPVSPVTGSPAHALRTTSMFAIAPPEPRTYQVHDLVQIIVRETSQAKSSQDLKTKKDASYKGKIAKFPAFNLSDLLQLQIDAGRTSNSPELDMSFTKDFDGQGDYERKDDLTARLTAEVIEVQPNGNLVLEARTHIKTDDEDQTMKATGICRPADITPANTILSNQLHDLTIEKINKGELRKSAEKGIIAKVLETIFAF